MKISTVTLFISVLLFSCGITDNKDVKDEVFSGITERMENEALGSHIDSTDWLSQGCIIIEDTSEVCMLGGIEAYPNPGADIINLEFQIAQNGFVKVAVNEKPDSEIKVFVNQYLSSGSYVYQIDVKKTILKSGIYRIYIAFEAEDGKTYKSFGDIMVP